MPADVLTFADWIATTLTTSFLNAAKPATISREYEIAFDIGTFTGLRVVIFPVSYVRESPATRREDNFDIEIVMVVAERYASPGQPSKSWVDERTNLVDQLIYTPLAKITQPIPLNEYWLQDIDVTTVYDLKMLRQQKVFWSEIETTFRKLRQ